MSSLPKGQRLADGPMLPAPRNPLWARCRRVLTWLGIFGLVVVALALAHRPILVGFARLFRVDEPVPSDAIVLLLGGADHRASKAADLFRRRLAPRVVLARSRTTGAPDSTDTELNRKELVRNGVPIEAIEILPGIGTSTYSEARLARDYAQAQGLRSLLVVSTAFHTARSRWVFRKVLSGTDIAVHVAAAEHPNFNEEDWYTKDEGQVAYFSEVLKSIYYRLVY